MPPKWTTRKGEVLSGDAPDYPEPGETFANSKSRHGTSSGWRLHQDLGEEPCAPCAQAKAAYDWRWLHSDNNTKRNRIHAKAQMQAMTILKRRYYDEYREIYVRLRDQLLEEAGLEVRGKK